MIKLGCLFRNTEIHEELKNTVSILGDTLLNMGKIPSLAAIYNLIRNAGIEVDLQTVGHVYKEVLPRDDKNFMSNEQVDEYTLKNYEAALKRASKIRTVTVDKELGSDKSELNAVIGILNMFAKANTTVKETKSIHIQMQEALWKQIQRTLNLPMTARPQNSKEWQDILTKALGFEKMGVRDLSGKLNSIGDLFNGMLDMLEQANTDMSATAKPIAMARWSAAVDALRTTAYSLLLSTGEARNMVIGLMKDAGFSKTVTLGNGTTREVIDWTKLAGDIGSIDDVRMNVQKVMQDKGYDQRTTDAVKDALVEEFNDLRQDIIQKQIDQEERIAREGTNYTLDDAGLQQALGNQTPAEWIKTESIENVEDLERKANEVLAGKKYIPAVRTEIINRLKDFFDRNYAKLVSREAKEAVKDLLGGRTALQWIQENGIHNQQELYDALRAELTQRDISPEHMQEIGNEFVRILDINNRSQRTLNARENALGRKVDTKTDVRRLAELFNLGLYDSTQHRELLYNLMGVPDLVVEDLHDIEQISKAASDLFRKIDRDFNDQIFATREFQFLQRHIDRIVARNINNKTKLLKILGGIRAFYDLYLSGLLSGPFTIMENMWSGIKVALSSILGGKGKVEKEDLDAYWKMLLDVANTGQAYGEEVGSFAPRELFSNMLSWKWKGGTKEERMKSLLYLMHFPGRVGLLGFDSANKVFSTNQIFKHVIYQALRSERVGADGLRYPGMDHISALHFMHDALYGASFIKAKEQAEEILNSVNANLPERLKRRITPAAITTLANDLVKANLTANQVLPTELVREAYKGAYHVAGYGLGHEPNNFLSKAIAELRKSYKMKEEQLIKDKDWEGLAMQRMVGGMLVNNMIIKFMGGATNWIWLRFQEAGLGLVTGGIGHWNHDIDFKDKDTIKKSIRDIHLARHKIARAMVGMSAAVMAYALMFLMRGNHDQDKQKIDELTQKIRDLAKQKGEDLQQALIDLGVDGVTKENAQEKKQEFLLQWKEDLAKANSNASFYKKVKSNWMLKRAFIKLAPDAMLLNYFMDTEKTAMAGAMKYVQNTAGVGSPYGADQQFNDAMKMMSNGDLEGGQGVLGRIVGGNLGVPMWRAYKDWYKLGKWIGGKEVHSDWRDPTNFFDGVVGGGMLEDLGVWKPKARITLIDGIGSVTYQRFKEHGIKSMEDIKDNPEWYKLKYTDDDGNEKWILGPAEQLKAKKQADEWFNEQLK